MDSRLAHFIPSPNGPWKIREIRPVRGDSLPHAARLDISPIQPSAPHTWTLRGIRSNSRYSTAEEKAQLDATQEGLGRPDSSTAVLIPIRKSEAWWQLSQDQRRAIFEDQSRHTAEGLKYLPAIARRLYHCRDLSADEPFDFLTWFEFHPKHEPDFDSLLAHLRASPEWDYVEREVDIRLER